MKISPNEFHPGMSIEMDGEVYTVIEFQHSKLGRGGAFVRTKLKSVETGNILRKTFQGTEKVNKAFLDKKPFEYLYHDGENYIFMDQTTYEQISLSNEDLGDGIKYLKDNMVLNLVIFQGRPIGIDLPIFVELKVQEAAPGIKGDTVSGASKKAILETGMEINVPLFIETGDLLKVDTRTGEYVERVTS